MCQQVNYTRYQKRVIKSLNDLLGVETPFTYERAKNNHLKVLIEGVAKPMYTGSTPSDCKSINNFMACVRREVKASKLKIEDEHKSAKVKPTNFTKQSNERLIQSCVKSLRTRILTLKIQEETSVLESQGVEVISGKRMDIVKHAINHTLKARKQGTYIKPKEMGEIEKAVMTHFNFMLPTMAYYSELLNRKNKHQVELQESVTNLAAAREDVSCNKAVSTLFANSKTEPKVANEMAIIPTTTNDSTIELMAMSTNNRISLLRHLTKAQMLTLIDDINQSMAQNREEDIEAVISLIRDKDLPLEVIISRMEAA
ncbi:hypothetical protein AB4139_12280 [Vibrio cyclitrophicus]